MTTLHNDEPKNNFKILAPTKAEKKRIEKAVKYYGCVQIVLGPNTINDQYVEIHVSDPIDLFYIGQLVMVYKLQE